MIIKVIIANNNNNNKNSNNSTSCTYKVQREENMKDQVSFLQQVPASANIAWVHLAMAN